VKSDQSDPSVGREGSRLNAIGESGVRCRRKKSGTTHEGAETKKGKSEGLRQICEKKSVWLTWARAVTGRMGFRSRGGKNRTSSTERKRKKRGRARGRKKKGKKTSGRQAGGRRARTVELRRGNKREGTRRDGVAADREGKEQKKKAREGEYAGERMTSCK